MLQYNHLVLHVYNQEVQLVYRSNLQHLACTPPYRPLYYSNVDAQHILSHTSSAVKGVFLTFGFS